MDAELGGDLVKGAAIGYQLQDVTGSFVGSVLEDLSPLLLGFVSNHAYDSTRARREARAQRLAIEAASSMSADAAISSR
jgi:hypothetical protein